MLAHFYSSANVCTPSRAGLLTGRYPVRSGLAKTVLFPFSDYGIGANEILLPEVLHEAGYATWMVGKWHLGHVPEAWPTRHGFDVFYGLPFSNDMPGVALYRGEDRVEFPLDQAALHDKLVDEAVRLIESASEQPFFLYLAPVAPHIPLYPGPQFHGRSNAGSYGDVVEELDFGVGRVLDALRGRNLEHNTLVVFTSDNGRAFEGSSGGLRGMKANTWEGAYAVPFLARWPASIEKGSRSTGIAMNIDLLPTLVHIAGAALPPSLQLDGRDISALLHGADKSPHEALYFFDADRIAAVRTQRWRYVVSTYYSKYEVDHLAAHFNYPLLFDFEAHGGELYNLAPSFPDVEKVMHGYLDQGRAALEGLPQNETPFPDAE
jgi:uncharacterized sulfatase